MLRLMGRIALIGLMTFISVGFAQQTRQSPNPLEVTIRIESAKSKVPTGDPIELVVTITNKGQRSLLIGRNLPGIGSDAAHVSFLISDKHGRSPDGWASAGDRFVPNPETLANAVMKNWLAMPPQSSYSFSTDVRRYASEFFEKPGLYKVQATYTSTGIRTQIVNQRLNATDEDIKRLPFPAWEGIVRSNELWIEVLPRPGHAR